MIYLVTGTPGAGKTLFTILMLSEVRDRPIYYYKIKLKPAGVAALPNWTEISKEDLEHWSQYPDGSIFLVDEAHTVFPQRGTTAKLPQFIEDLAEHRHRGMDFYVIDQHPKDVDIFIRRRTYQHWHWVNVFGMDSSTKMAWQGYTDEQPDDYHAKKKAEKSRHKFPKQVYDWYESASVHTKKKRIPWQIYAIPVLLLVAGLLAWYAFHVLMKEPEPELQPVQPSSPAEPVKQQPQTAQPVAIADQSEDAPRKRPRYKDFRNNLIPPYVFKAAMVYLDGAFDAWGRVGAEYTLVLDDGQELPVDNRFFLASGASIRVLEPKCTHQITYQSFDLFTQCRPRPADEQLPDNQNSDGQGQPMETKPLDMPSPTVQPQLASSLLSGVQQ